MSNGSSTIAALLRECGSSRDLARGRQLHSQILSAGYRSTVLENSLVRMYGDCGSLDEAVDAFSRISSRNVFSWNILLSAFAQRGHLDLARAVLEIFPEFDTVSHNILLAAYARSCAIPAARDLFQRMPDRDLVSWNTLLAGLASNGYYIDAKNTFDTMPRRNLLSWNSMLATGDGEQQQLEDLEELFEKLPQRCIVSWTEMVSAYAQHGHFQSSWSLFLAMPERSIVSLNSAMQAFDREETVATIFEKMPERNLVSFNLRLGATADGVQAMELLDFMPERNIASWTSVLAVFSKNSDHLQTLEPAERIFSRMPQWDGLSCNAMARLYSEADDLPSTAKIFHTNLRRDAVSWNTLITSYGRRGDVTSAREVFHRMPLHTLACSTAMLVAISRSGDDSSARDWFESMPFHDIVSWNAMIFAAAGKKESFVLFRRMQLEGTRPTYVTYATMIDSCAEAAALGDGRAIHERILQLGSCGAVEEALDVFQSMRRRDLITWSTIVSGYAWNGLGERSAQLFQFMLLEGLDPSSVTLVNVLTSCSHGGLLDFGRRLFVFVTAEVPGFPVCREHYDCLVDLLGRSGRLEEALELMESMPFEPTALGRMSFAASCRKQHLEGDLNLLYEDTNYMALKGA
ncbi:pentatricopeptide repeat-containing protein At4g02750 isoform X2 [Selaginella moellendorffii]|uniref:pentatricopeptide repeat-containing protein At4g02750 isoform X2 n=1 Tax=Selaginella moellendorffii TaxID=88036 RepID=UPI000D1C5D06|nr:pentatricopeptide repeat-containing protein At4g02750 isoform X2 [Selaginella moellendorffii]|eukprot:XP_024533410.1 pentatricopeptide repeat-containing protein At4g02750 isoform X2 [Selaginella moellendorffii]